MKSTSKQLRTSAEPSNDYADAQQMHSLKYASKNVVLEISPEANREPGFSIG